MSPALFDTSSTLTFPWRLLGHASRPTPLAPARQVCYDNRGNARLTNGMYCPAMYGAMAANLGLPYWVTTGRGDYGTSMEADLTQLRAAAAQALAHVYRHAHAHEPGPPGSGTAGGAREGAAGGASGRRRQDRGERCARPRRRRAPHGAPSQVEGAV